MWLYVLKWIVGGCQEVIEKDYSGVKRIVTPSRQRSFRDLTTLRSAGGSSLEQS
jgi:hypothetical protein